MSELKDQTIKLFGKTIPLPVLNLEALANESSSAAAVDYCCDHNIGTSLHAENNGVKEVEKEPSGQELTEDDLEDGSSHQKTVDSKDPTTSSGISENPKTPSFDRETLSVKSSKDGEQSEASISEEKTLKKPDKILPCPRCNSMETKFCYFNNYNVNQPRHFCKNCQRYWTAGGTMRNVPVGAGRRKNKSSSASHYRHIMVSEALRTAQANVVNGLHDPSLGNTGTVLTFGSDSPLCEPVASVLDLSEQTQNCVRNGIHKPEQRILVSCGGADKGDDRSSGSSITASNSSEKGGNAGLQEAVIKNYQGFPPQVPCFPVPPWPYPWNSAQWNSGMPPPAFCPPGFPVSFYPPPTYWGCTVPGHWNVPRLPSQSSSLNHCAPSSSPTSPTLGKRSRDGNILNSVNLEKEEALRENNSSSENSVLVPKTLRIDDPSEAAKSSIWATLGIKSEKPNSINGGGLFKGFQLKGDDRNCMTESSRVLHANPAALSRSLNFHESS